jgi:stalled ribosome rescue protein Dom34
MLQIKEKSMKRNMGVWIDHRRAVIVSLRDQGDEIREVPSNMEKHIRFSGGAQVDSADDKRDMRFTGHLHKYYDKVVSYLRDADSILVLGPGEAKGEFVKRMKVGLAGVQIDDIETADKMTHHQIVEKVREHFLVSDAKIEKVKAF